jgi:hydrogenase-4 component F
VAFFSAGTIAQLHRSSDFEAIGPGTLGRAPMASALLLLAAMFVTGSPPFSMFFSEMMILRGGFLGSHVTATSVFLAALVILFCGFAYQIGRLVLGPQARDRATAPDPETFDFGMGVTFMAATLAIISTFYLPGPLIALIRAAANVVSGSA